MFDLSIPEVGEESKTAKDLIFSILTRKKPLSAIELNNLIHKEYHAGLTYQAIKKALESLVSKEVLVKNERKYQIRKEWLLHLKKMIDNVLLSYSEGTTVHGFTDAVSNKDYAIYTLTNLLDLDNFWNELLLHLARNLNKDEPKQFYSCTHYGWWLLINMGKETKLFDELKELGITCHNRYIGNVPLNRWAKKVYQGAGVDFKIINDSSIDDSIATNIVGNTVVQVKYPQKIINHLRNIFSNTNSIHDLSHGELAKLANEECEIKLSVFKNMEIAASLRERYSKIR